MVVKRCVEAHRGTITFRSSAGQGTSFTITIPS
jgi:signal transduction histidine kinase